MERYVGTKVIEARPMNRGTYNLLRGWQIPENENPNDEGYQVKYEDGYISWSPKETFEAAYRKSGELDFGAAKLMLKHGWKAGRKGWNGKGMYIQYVNGIDFEHAIIEPFLVIKNVKNSFNTWVPSISDLFAEDWEVWK
jgi:hypothetical protein